MKYIIAIPDAIKAQGKVTHTGRSGANYFFFWSDEFRKHVLNGKSLDPQEFNKVARDIFSVSSKRLYPVPEIVLDIYKDVPQRDTTPPTPVTPPPFQGAEVPKPKKGPGRPPKVESNLSVVSAIPKDTVLSDKPEPTFVV